MNEKLVQKQLDRLKKTALSIASTIQDYQDDPDEFSGIEDLLDWIDIDKDTINTVLANTWELVG